MSPQRAFELRRVTALVGPYGSGKTELSIGLSLHAAERARQPGAPFTRAVLGDLDVIKPYFRSRESGDLLNAEGIELLAPKGALARADLPIVTPELRGAVARHDVGVVLDIGGDPVGARALGSLSDVMARADHDLLLVLNRHRPFMDTFESVLEQAHKISAAARLPLTGVVSNTHMLDESTGDDVLWGLELARQVAAALDVPVKLLAVPGALQDAFAHREDLPPVVAIHRRIKPHFLGGVVLAPAHDIPPGRSRP